MGEHEPNQHVLGDGAIQEIYRIKMSAIAEGLDQVLNGVVVPTDRETGFVLLVYPFGNTDDGRVNFISNGADRKDIVALFKHMIARFEGQPDVTGTA